MKKKSFITLGPGTLPASKCLAILLSNSALSLLLSGSSANLLRSIVWPLSERFDRLPYILFRCLSALKWNTYFEWSFIMKNP